MLGLRKLSISGVLAITLATGIVVVAPADAASALAASGVISRYVKNYDDWHMRTPATGVLFRGEARDWALRAWETLTFRTTDQWTLGLRTRSNTQFSKLTFTGRDAAGMFPYAVGATTGLECAVNTRVVGVSSDPDAIATFSRSLTF